LSFIVFGALSLGVCATELALVDAPYASRAPFDNALTVVLVAGYASLALSVLQVDGRALERRGPRALPLRDPQGHCGLDADYAAIMRALEHEKLYRTPGLSIAALARHLAIPEYRVRALINKRLGYRNFNALLHKYRLHDACRRLADPA